MAKSGKKRIKKVWRIFRFKERFELADNVRFCRQSPLLFTRDFVGSGKDDESIGYAQQMQILRMSPRRLVLKGAFGELKEIAANRSRAYRGYLLDERFEPATDSRVAMWLGLEIKEARSILKELAKIGLIERVDLPIFDERENLPPDKPGDTGDSGDDDGGDGPDQPSETPTDKPGDTGDSGDDDGPDQPSETPNSSAHEPARDPFKKRKTAKTKKTNGNGNGKTKKKIKKTAKKKTGKKKKKAETETKTKAETEVGKAKLLAQLDNAQSDKDNPKAEECKNNASAGSEGQSQGQQQAETACRITDRPTDPEAGCDALSADIAAPSILDDGLLAERIANSRVPGLGIMSGECREFSAEIFRLLGTESKCLKFGKQAEFEAYKELQAFGHAWKRARDYLLDEDSLERLWKSVIKDAATFGRARARGKRFKKSPEAAWMWLFDTKLAKYRELARAPG